MPEHEDDEVRDGTNNHALVMSNGIVLIGGEIRRVNSRFVRVMPYDPDKSLKFATIERLRSLIKHHTVVFVPVKNDTLDVRGANVLMIEDAHDR